VAFELKLGRCEPEYVGKPNFYVQLVDDPTQGMLLAVGATTSPSKSPCAASEPLAVTEWRLLPAKVRQALPTAEDLSATTARTVREIGSAASASLCPHR
jgi:hypothetical protein